MSCVHSLEKLFSAITIPVTFDLEASLSPSENSRTILRVPERDHSEINKQQGHFTHEVN